MTETGAASQSGPVPGRGRPVKTVHANRCSSGVLPVFGFDRERNAARRSGHDLPCFPGEDERGDGGSTASPST